MRKLIKYSLLSFMAFCTAFVVYGVGQGMLKGWRNADERKSASSSSMTREDWLARFKPLELAGQCADSPVKRSLQESQQQCLATVEPLFERCASGNIISIPPVIRSRAEAQKYGSLMGECITAHHLGGDHLKMFLASLKMRKT